MEADRTEKQYKIFVFWNGPRRETMTVMFTSDGPTETIILVQVNGPHATELLKTLDKISYRKYGCSVISANTKH